MFRTAVLVIHGFCGSLWENENLVNYLQQYKKLDVYAYTLPDHEKDFLTKSDYRKWISATEKHVQNLLKKYSNVILIGHSMGGVIASYIATKYKIKKLILVAPAFEYLNFEQNKADLLNKNKKKKDNTSLYDEVVTKLIRYSPLVLNEFRKLVKEYKETIKNVKVPTLILHGDDDELVPFSSSEYAFNNINTKEKHLTLIKGRRHRVFLGDGNEIICEYVYKFIKGGLIWTLTKKQEL